jgi:outer membrane receptor protein involved in Fe transport
MSKKNNLLKRLTAAALIAGVSWQSVRAQDDAPMPTTPQLPTIEIPGETPGETPTTPAPDVVPLDTPAAPPMSQPPPSPTTPRQPAPSTTAPLSGTIGGQATINFPSLSETMFAPGVSGATRGVTDSLFDSPSLSTVVTRQDLVERQATTMFDALQYESGVMMQRTGAGQASPFVRGLTGQQVLFTIDGIRMNNSTYRTGPNQYFNTIDPGQVEQIEVIRGPASVLYGSDAIGGQINIVTRSPDFSREYFGGGLRETFGTASAQSYTRLNVEGHAGNFGAFGGGSYLNANDLDTGGPLNVQEGTAYNNYGGDLKLMWELNDFTYLTVATQHFEQEVARSDRFFPFIPLSSERPTYFDPQQRNLAYVRLESYCLCSPIMDDFAITASYSRQKEGSTVVDQRGTRNNLDVAEFDLHNVGLNIQASRDMEEFGRLTYGADWYHDDVDAVADRYRATTGAFVGPRTPQFPDDSYYDRLGAFLYWNVDLNDWLNFQTGTRYETIDVGGTPIANINGTDQPFRVDETYQDWIAAGALTVKMTEDWHLIGSISEGYRAPNLDDLVATNPFVQQAGTDLPSVDLAAESAIVYEVGTKFNTDIWRAQAFYFWNDLEANILRAPTGTTGDPLFERTNRDSYLHGFEITQELLLTDTWSLWGNYFYTYGKDDVNEEPLSRVPPQQGTLGLRYRTCDRRSWFDVFVWMVDNQDRLAPQDLSDARIPDGGTPGFATLNLRTGTTLGDDYQHRVGLFLENITDKGYRVHGSGVDGPGFNAMMTYEFIH